MGTDQPAGRDGLRGLTRTASGRKSGTSFRSCGSASARAKRILAAQLEDSVTTVILPPSSEHVLTLFPSSGPSAFITATCHSDDSGVERARSTSLGRRVEIKSPAVTGLPPGRTVCLFRVGLLGIVSRQLGLRVLPVKRLEGAMTSRLPAQCKPLKHQEQGLEDLSSRHPPELAR